MWNVAGTNLQMAEKDYGIQLPFSVTGTTLTALDQLKFTFKDVMNGTTILEKTYTTTNNAATLMLTEAESDLFPVGTYVYRLDWYQDGTFMCNLVLRGLFKVVDKA